MLNKIETYFILLITGIFFVACLSAGIFLRPLNNEASTWLYMILNNHWFAYDLQFFRFTDLIWQAPSLLILKWFGPAGVSAAVQSYSFMLAMHPFVSWVICLLIIYKRNRLEILPYFIFGFYSINYLTLYFSAGVVITGLSLFWPLVALIWTNDYKQRSDLLWTLFLVFLGCFTHETAIFFLTAVAAVFLYDLVKKDSGNRKEKMMILFATLAGVLFYLFRLISVRSTSSMSHFQQQMLFLPWTFKWSLLFFFFIFILMIANFSLSKLKENISRNLLAVFAIIPLLYYFLRNRHSEPPFSDAYTGRIIALPIMGLFLLVTYWVFSDSNLAERATKHRKMIYLLCCSMALVCFYDDFSTTRFWRINSSAIQKFSETNLKCISILDQNNDYGIKPDGIGNGFFYSLVSQRKPNPDFVLIVRSSKLLPGAGVPSNPCYIDKDGNYVVDENSKIRLKSNHFNTEGLNLGKYDEQTK